MTFTTQTTEPEHYSISKKGQKKIWELRNSKIRIDSVRSQIVAQTQKE